MNYLLIFFTSLIFTLFFTPYLISYLKRSRVVDLPGKRRIHTSVVPRMGGLIIFLITSVMLLSFYTDLNAIRLVIIAANIILLIGIFDDMLGLDYSAKFLLQVAATILVIFYLAVRYENVQLFGVTIPYPLDYILLGLFILGGINSINLLDGMDGLVSGFSLLIFSIIMALAVISGDTFLLIISSSLLGSLLGFLKYNAYPAKIFLGDTGSLTLGFFLVTTAILTSINYSNNQLDLTFPIILMAIPIIDTLRVMLFRIIRKQNPFLPDRTHLHHIISENNISHKFTVFLIEGFTVIFVILGLYYIKVSHFVPTILFFIISFALLFINPIIRFIISRVNIKNYSFTLKNKYPLEYLLRMEKSLIIFSTLLIAQIVVSNFPQRANISTNLVLMFFIIGIIMFLLAYDHQKKSKDISDLYTFINLSAFFIITNLNSTSIFSLSENHFYMGSVTEVSYYLLTLMIVLIFLISEKVFPVKKIALSGIDLTLIIFIILVLIIKNLISFHFDEFFSISFIQAFIFYLWYKIIITVKSEFSKVMFYASFALPFSALIILFFY